MLKFLKWSPFLFKIHWQNKGFHWKFARISFQFCKTNTKSKASLIRRLRLTVSVTSNYFWLVDTLVTALFLSRIIKILLNKVPVATQDLDICTEIVIVSSTFFFHMKQTQINSGHICMTIIVEQNRIPNSFLVNGLCEKDWFQIFLGNRRRRIQAERLFAKNFILDVWQGDLNPALNIFPQFVITRNL